jgi:hypothetical protein
MISNVRYVLVESDITEGCVCLILAYLQFAAFMSEFKNDIFFHHTRQSATSTSSICASFQN